jgi:succinyl-CoA synthetase alpha subunit
MSLRGGLELLPDANLAVISVAGRYAGDVAMQALEQGLHVMLFSDNVPIEKEVELKEFARDKGLLVMGPDCGTAIINGVPLAFANVVPRGRVGIVAASGTGLQEVSCLLANEGCGISQAIGTGGRDVKNRVGGIMFLEALKALGEDEDTDVIVLIAKPPDATVLQAVDALVESLDKPVVSILLGADRTGLLDATTLEEAALMAAALTRGDDPASAEALIADREAEINKVAEVQAQRLEGGRQYVRGLFSGGTFCTEAQLLLADILVPLYANAPVAGVEETEDLHTSKAHTLIDMGEDEFTVGRPHPMIDYSLRNKRIAQEAADPETAVILLDVVLGYGSNMDPASELEEVVREAAGHVAVVCSVTGTAGDPQDRAHVVQTLEKAGAVVLPSNASACRCAGHIIRELEAAS